MSAIHPERLAKQVEELLSSLGQPKLLVKELRELLEFYTDRTRRSVMKPSSDISSWAFNVPRPVLRSLSSGLRSGAQTHPELAWPVIHALWDVGTREMQYLAAAILAGKSSDDVIQFVALRAEDCRDPIVRDELARTCLQAWRRRDAVGFIEQVSDWLGDSARKIRVFGLIALEGAVQDGQFTDLPTVFQLLAGISVSARDEERRSLGRVIRSLARRSPQEAARFLLDEQVRNDTTARRLIRDVRDAFPPRQRELLERALSA
jgi:hypothetical protein